MDRRSFMLAAAVMAAGCSRTAKSGVMETTRTAPLGTQLYSVRDLMVTDVTATLELIASTGYREVEFAGYSDYGPAALNAILGEVGLRAPSAHLPYSAFAESPEKVLEHATAMGHQFVEVPWLDTDSRSFDIERDNLKDIKHSLQHNFDAIEPLWTSHK